MRLPAVAIAAVFASGAVLGQAEWFAKRASSHTFLTAGFVTVESVEKHLHGTGSKRNCYGRRLGRKKLDRRRRTTILW